MQTFSLKTKLALCSLLIFLVFASSTAFVTIRYFQNRFQQSIGNQQFSMVTQVASEFDSKIKLAEQSLAAVGKKITAEMITNPEIAQKFLSSRIILFTMFNNGINLFSANGTLLAEAPDFPSPLIGRNFSDRDYIKKTLAAKKPIISPPFISIQPDRHPLIMFTYPVMGQNGEVLAILTGCTDLIKPNLFGSLVDTKIGKTGYMYLATTDNLIVIHPDPKLIMKELTVENPLFSEARSGYEGSGRTVNYQHIPVLSSFKRLATTNWILVASLPLKEAFAPVNTAMQGALLIILFGAGTIAIIYWYVMGYLITPLQRVIENIKGTDRSDLTQLGSVAVSTRDEIMELTVAFNTLMQQIGNEAAERIRAEEELQRLNDELEQRVLQRTAELNSLNRELESFSYSISHDLRAPLLRISGYASILEEDCAGKLSADELHYLARLKSSCQMMNNLIEALLNLSRMCRDEMDIVMLDLSAMAREIFATLASSEPERLVELAVEDRLQVQGDATLLKSLLENLLGNAWKYTAKTAHARIEFGMMQDDARQLFYVKDNGAGFDMKYVDKLFAPFMRLHGENEFSGIGIGLATVQRIVRRHGGDIWAKAKEGEGATFYFTLGGQEPDRRG